MKILILGSNLSSEAGGYSHSTFLLRDSLKKIKGNQVYTLGYWVSKFFHFEFSLSDKTSFFSFGIFKIFPFSILYYKKIKIIKPDIIDIQGLWNSASIFNFLYFKITSTPYIITPRGMLEKWALRRSFYRKFFFLHFLEKFNLKNAMCLRATSRLEAETFKSLNINNKIINVPNSIKISKFNLKKKNKTKKKKLLFLSRLHPKKGVSELLHVWKVIQDKNLDWELVICGFDENNYKKSLLRLSEQLSLKRVFWLGAVYGEKKNKLYQSCDLFILLSHSENFGLVIAEALSFGLPVITTNRTPWIELNKKKCGWYIELKMKKIISTLNYAMKLSDAKRFRMGKRGRKWIIKDFSPNSVGQKMQKVYKWILKKGPKPKNLVVN